MAIYRNVQLSFWTDNKVEDEFTPEDKYFYLYLLTNPQTNICGCYEVSYSQMTHQTGYNKDTINRLLERFEKVHNIIRYSKGTKEVLILHWHKYNWSKSEDVLKGVLRIAEYIKCEAFKNYIVDTVECIKNKRVCRPSIDPLQTSVSDTVINNSINMNTNNNISNINNINKSIDNNSFNVEKAWNDTKAIYPRITSAVMAKQEWLKILVDTPECNRKDVAVLVYNAIKFYLSEYKKSNEQDEDYHYIPAFHNWLTRECGYWITQYEQKKKECGANDRG